MNFFIERKLMTDQFESEDRYPWLYDHDNATMESSTESLCLEYQAINKYNKLLPYADEMNKEAIVMLSEIKGQLGRAVALRKLQPDCTYATLKLQWYIKLYSLQFTKEDHILFIKLMYELVTIPNLESGLMNLFASTLIILLKKRRLLTPNDLELPWRPLYDLKERLVKVSISSAEMHRVRPRLSKVICNLINEAKFYFPLSATQEILDDIRPLLCPLTPRTMSTGIENLNNFLPFQIPPEHHHLGFKLWFDELMTLWERNYNATSWQAPMMMLMSKLAVRNIGYIDWEPHIPLMFTRFIRSLNLPVHYKQTQGNKPYKFDTRAMASWIVAVLGNNSSGQKHLEKLLKTIETYTYQANVGPWVEKLKDFLGKLASQFVERLHNERYAKKNWEMTTPDSHKLTDADVDAFVKCMMPVAMTAMFGQSGIAGTSAVFRTLATIRPNLVIPGVIECMFSTLDSLTEPHKLTAAMMAAIAVARPLVQGRRNINTGYTYNEGPSRVLPLLMSFLPGIDGNDLIKTSATFQLISIYSTMVPIADCSRASTEHLDEDDRRVCEETAQFEDFILQCFDRIFSLVESSAVDYVTHENQAGDAMNRLELIREMALNSVSTLLLRRTSSNIFQAILHKLRVFVTEHVLETKVSGPLAANICRSFSRINGRETLKALLPTLAETIIEYVDEDDVVKDENLDNCILYALLLVANIVDTQGDDLLPYMDTLTEILDKVLNLKSPEGTKLATRILACILVSLSRVSLCYDSISDGKDYNDPNYPYVLDWGQGADIDDLDLRWYIPGEEEVVTIQKMFNRFLPTEIKTIKAFISSEYSVTRQELHNSVAVVTALLDGAVTVLPFPEDGSRCVEQEMLPYMGLKGEVTMPDGGNVRQEMVKLLSDLQTKILISAEDDTKTLKCLSHMWSILLLGKYRQIEDFRDYTARIGAVKMNLQDDLVKKRKHLASCLLERTSLQNDMRMMMRIHSLMNIHKDILRQLFKLATSTYAEIRSRSQQVLFTALTYFRYAYKVLLPNILELLAKDPEEHHEAYKGLWYVLHGPRSCPLVSVNDWEFLRSLWPALVSSKFSEKISIIRQKNALNDIIYRSFCISPIELDIPESCVTIAIELWTTSPKPSALQPRDREMEEGIENMKRQVVINRENYDALLESIVSVIENNCHWRQRSMGMKLLRYLAHCDRNYSPRVINYFLNALVHESLEERKIAIPTVVTILRQLKREHKKIKIQSPECPADALPGIRPDNLWLQYNHATAPKSESQWNDSHYGHQLHVGYYIWAKELQVYAPSTDQPSLESDRVLTESEQLVDTFFNERQNIDKLIKYNSLEEHKGKDKFNDMRFHLYRGLFRNHGIKPLAHFLPHLEILVVQKQESNQVCAAEIIAGVSRGAKHWPYSMVVQMWEKILPIIRVALENTTTESIRDWGICFGLAVRCRDANRYHWLLECLMEEPTILNTTASSLECQRLFIIQSALINQSWRVAALYMRLLDRVERRLLTNPLQNVRISLGNILTIIFSADNDGRRLPEFATPNPQEFINRVLPQVFRLPEINATELENLKQEISTLKIICKWITTQAFSSERGTMLYATHLLPVLCQLENYEGDDELRVMCRRALAVLAQTQALPAVVNEVLQEIEKVFRTGSWSAKATGLSFLEVFVFYHMGLMISKCQWVQRIENIVLKSLEDDTVEVRQKAGQLLCGLLHCDFVPKQDALLNEFKIMSRKKVRNPDDLRLKHAGVLGLCSFVKAHPYHVPKYMPSIFESLSMCLNDPQPIATTIRITLGDFKRTHYDGWALHAQSFTEEQLTILEDLSVPPSYYA